MTHARVFGTWWIMMRIELPSCMLMVLSTKFLSTPLMFFKGWGHFLPWARPPDLCAFIDIWKTCCIQENGWIWLSSWQCGHGIICSGLKKLKCLDLLLYLYLQALPQLFALEFTFCNIRPLRACLVIYWTINLWVTVDKNIVYSTCPHC